MIAPKFCGIETEYGVISRGVEMSPVTASSLLITAYCGDASRIDWDFAMERPYADLRGFLVDDRLDPEIDHQMVNVVLTNGARYYVDHAHPEYSSPECRTAFDVVRFDLAGDEILRRSMHAAREVLRQQDAEIIVYKNNSDGKGNSYGCHENYLVGRSTPFSDIVRFMTTHFVTRQVFTGSGKIGVENHVGSDTTAFQISQRADFFEEEVGLETTLRRPIINTRDEPHADAAKYRRLHVIVGDANMSEIATLVKVGSTQILLAMIEDDALPARLVLDEPLAAMVAVSRDVDMNRPLRLVDGSSTTALAIQFELLSAAERWIGFLDADVVASYRWDEIIEEWKSLLLGLANDREAVADRIDWLAKKRLIDAFRRRHDAAPHDARLKAIDLQYHDLRRERSLSERAGLRRLVEASAIQRAISSPPSDTRAFFRGELLRRWPDAVVAANWDSMVLDTGSGALVRVPMAEPGRGTEALVGKLLRTATDINEVLQLLAGRSEQAENDA